MAIKKVFLFWLIIILLTSSFTLVACTTTTQTSTSTPVITTTKSSSTATTSKVTTTSISTSTQANWWDKFGTPKYGGTINVVIGFMGLNLDVYQMVGADVDFWYENLFEPSWTMDRKAWPVAGNFFPDEYWSGTLAESWTIDDPTTITIKLREGVHWQNKKPVNGREFVASDVQAHYDRMLGTGGGYTTPSPMFAGSTSNWNKVRLRTNIPLSSSSNKVQTRISRALPTDGLSTCSKLRNRSNFVNLPSLLQPVRATIVLRLYPAEYAVTGNRL